MSSDILDKRLVERCADINSAQEYYAFLTDVRKITKEYDKKVIQPLLEPSNVSMNQCNALIYLAVQDTDVVPPQGTLDQILSQQRGSLCIAAASLYLITRRADDEAYFRELLLTADPLTRSKGSKEACAFLTKFMGFSGNTQFIPLLYEVLAERYHFCWQSRIVTALNNLDEYPNEDNIPHLRGIRIEKMGGDDSRIYIHTDERYDGSSECPQCRFFPCKINKYYAGGIHICKLWNNINPDTLDDIVDKRDWGEQLVWEQKPVEDNEPQQKTMWKQARQLMAKKSYCQAIPFLCSTLLLGETQIQQASALPLAWIYLSDCFEKQDEKALAFIAMREALQYKNLIPKSKTGERRKLQSFDDNPEVIIGPISRSDDIIIKKNILIKGYNYREHNQWVKACDHYVDSNRSHAGKDYQDWVNMGRSHRELGEYHLAELFMRRGMSIVHDRQLLRKSSQEADEIHELSLKNDVLGLNLERRRKERAPIPSKIEYGFCLDTYQFEEISEAAQQATQNCRGIRDFFHLSEAAYEQGELELAIEILQAAVNYNKFHGSKAYPLYMAARLQVELQVYDKAMKYLDWAMELKPDDENIRNVWTSLKTEMGKVSVG
jgi:tetratricopeptide (TPR) repeat protein